MSILTSRGTMTAWLQHRYGGPDTVTAETVAIPSPARDEVLIRVDATSLNSADVRLMRGEPRIVRLAFGLRAPRRPGRGMDVAGTVEALGEGVDGLAIGTRVVGELDGGGLAPFVVAPAKRLVAVPDDVALTDAACLPIAGGTAWQALDAGAVTGGRILVVGASGGVGTFTVQLAAERGAEVWALTGERSRALVHDLGAVRTFDYRSTTIDSPEFAPSSFDAVIVIAGPARLRRFQQLVRDGGRVVMVSGDGGRIVGPLGIMLRAALVSIGSRRRVRFLAATAKPEILRELVALVAGGRISVPIERSWPLADARAALEHIDAGHTVGKIVVTAT